MRLIGWRKKEESDVLRREQARVEFARVACMEETSFHQKSICLWLQEGDWNTKFFHRMDNVNRRGNQIGAIKIDGVQLSSKEEVREGITEFYRRLF